MSTGSVANLGSAATVAASSFNMQITDPRPFLESIDPAYLQKCVGYQPLGFESGSEQQQELAYSEPYGVKEENIDCNKPVPLARNTRANGASTNVSVSAGSSPEELIDGKVLLLGDFIDTDAVSRCTLRPHVLCTPRNRRLLTISCLMSNRSSRRNSSQATQQTNHWAYIAWSTSCQISDKWSRTGSTS